MKILLTVLGSVLLVFATGCSWKENVEVHGVKFQRAKITDNGFVVGYVDKDLTVAGRPCKAGWIQLHPNGALAGFTAAKDVALSRFRIPAGGWVMQNADGVVTICSFPRDTMVQGHLCRGGGLIGGSEGVQTSFYPDGALKQFFGPEPVRIDGVPCGADLFHRGIELYQNGHLKSATLSEDFVRDGRAYHKGERIQLPP